MPQPVLRFNPASVLHVHFCESDKYQGTPLQQAILTRCREMKIAGATVFRGLEGYGGAAEIHRHHLVTHDQPIEIVIVDSVENIDRLRPVVEEMLQTGVIAVAAAEFARVQKTATDA